jgi:DNA-binding transcriptional LysR family regulator
MNIAAMNLNLLLAFEALLDEQNVSRAAARVGLSQPAMSNALSRLRKIFGDPLFQRTSRGVKATPRALDLAIPVRNGLSQLRAALEKPPQFDPANSSRIFRIAMTDYAEFVLLGSLLRSVSRAAPSVQIVVRRADRIFVPPEDLLRMGRFDAAIGFFPEANALQPRTQSLELFAEENVCIGRERHPLMRKRFGIGEFTAAGHVGVFYSDDTVGLIDSILAGHGLRRRLQATTPHFLSAVAVVANSDLIAVVPAGLARRFQPQLKLEIRKLPILLPTFHMRLLWHQHVSEDPAHQWLRSEIARSVGLPEKTPPTR